MSASLIFKRVLTTAHKQRPNFVRGFATTIESSINITFVDREGNRATVPGRIGSTLFDVAKLHRVDLEGSCSGGGAPSMMRRTKDWVEPTFGEGPQCFHCHVQIPSTFNHVLNEQFPGEKEGLKTLWEDEYNSSSRLACLITLERKHDGLVVFVLDDPKRPFVSPEEIGSFVLQHLKRMAERKLGRLEAVSRAVISVPAEFDDTQRNATLKAARLAGIDVYRIINEPTAAALAYGLHKKEGVDHVLIFDLGGGTLDVSLLLIQGGMLITRATAGHNHLGGQDFTQRLYQRLSELVHERFQRKLEDKEDLQNLRLISETSKVDLTNNTWTEIDVPLHSFSSDSRLHYIVTREEFESLNEDLFSKVLKPVEAALTDVGASKDDVDEVVLVGGSTRIPKLRRIIADYFGKEPNYDIDPELAVVTGVAVQSGVVTGGWPLQVSATELPTKLKKIHVYD